MCIDMQRFRSIFEIAGSGVMVLVSAGCALYCMPWGANDSKSYNGFLVITLYFFIQAITYAIYVRFGEPQGSKDKSPLEYFCHGINKLAASIAVVFFALPHPSFIGWVLWLGAAGLLFYSSVRNLYQVALTVIDSFRRYMADFDYQRKRVKAEIEMARSMQAEETRRQQAAQVEKDLLADLSDFLEE